MKALGVAAGCSAMLAAVSAAIAAGAVDAQLDELVQRTYQQQKPASAPALRVDGSSAGKAASDVGATLRQKAAGYQSQMLDSMRTIGQHPQAASALPGAQAAGALPDDAMDGSDAAPAGAARNGNCPRTLALLANRLPRYADPNLQNLRQQMLAIDVVDTMAKAQAQGYSPQAAAKATVLQAQEADRALSDSEACVRAYSPQPAAAIAALRNGTAPINGMKNATAACSGAYVAAYYAAVAMRELAIDMACLAN